MTVRLAVLGCGAVARRYHLPALRGADADVTVFASRTLASAQEAAVEWGAGDVTDDWRTTLERDDVDAVDVCTLNALHAEMAVAAARAGKHVLVEKPMARSVAEADRMVAAARDAGVVLMVAHNVRYVPAFVAVREAVASGRIGRVTSLRAAFGHTGPGDWAPGSTWFFDPDQAGGGVLIDLGIHVADLLRNVLGDEVAEVSAMTYGDGAVEEAAQVLLRWGSGAVGTAQVSWIARPGPDHQLTIFGTEGTIHLDTGTPPTLRAADGAEEQLSLPEEASNPYAEFVEAVGGVGSAGVSGTEGRAALAVVEAAYEAAASGRTVRPPAP